MTNFVTFLPPPTQIPAVEVDSRLTASKKLLLDQKIDLNQAGYFDLVALPGIGPSMAQQILKNRGRKGRFQTVDSLKRIRGIGSKKLEILRPYVVVNGKGDR